MILGRYQFHEMLSYYLFIFACERGFHIGIYHALLCHIIADIVVHQFGIILCSHSAKRLLLSLGYAKLVKSILYIFGHIIP